MPACAAAGSQTALGEVAQRRQGLSLWFLGGGGVGVIQAVGRGEKWDVFLLYLGKLSRYVVVFCRSI